MLITAAELMLLRTQKDFVLHSVDEIQLVLLCAAQCQFELDSVSFQHFWYGLCSFGHIDDSILGALAHPDDVIS